MVEQAVNLCTEGHGIGIAFCNGSGAGLVAKDALHLCVRESEIHLPWPNINDVIKARLVKKK